MSTQLSPHAVRPSGHWHVPATQVAVLGQRTPQPPQLWASFSVSAQYVPQSVVPLGQTQTPSAHDAPGGQTRPHDPQWLASVDVSAHRVPQSTSRSGTGTFRSRTRGGSRIDCRRSRS